MQERPQAGGTPVCMGKPEPTARGRGKDYLSSHLCLSMFSSSSVSLPAPFQLEAFIWGCPSLGAHSSPRTPHLRGASQAQHIMKGSNSGGDLLGYKNTGYFISSKLLLRNHCKRTVSLQWCTPLPVQQMLL